jgi:hypothetical protein
MSIPLLKRFVTDEVSPGAAATGIVALGLLGEPTAASFIRPYLNSTIVELRWASAFALTRYGIVDSAVVDVLIDVVAQPPEASETMSFLSGSYLSLATMALAGTPAAMTLKAVDAVLAGLADCAGVDKFYDRHYTVNTLFPLLFPHEPADPPPSFSSLSEAQKRIVGFVAEHEKFSWSYGAMEAFRRWKVPTKHAELGAFTGAIQEGDK